MRKVGSAGMRDGKSECDYCCMYQYHRPAVTPADLICCVREGGRENGMAKREGVTIATCIYTEDQPSFLLVEGGKGKEKERMGKG